MPGPHPAVAVTRRVVRDCLSDVPEGAVVLVGCSGGADSLALAAAVAFLVDPARPTGRALRAVAVCVDHGLQPGSARVAGLAAARCRAMGLEAEVLTVSCRASEEAARQARYAALDAAAERFCAAAVLLGHTQDDQTEQVLLGLLRGSGTRSLAGMPARRGRYRRPFLREVGRRETAAACGELGLDPWQDPANSDPACTRVRARDLLRRLEAELGAGIRAGLLRTASLAGADADALDALAAQARHELPRGPVPATALATLPAALRTRVLRLLAVEGGARNLTVTQVEALDALVTDWHGQGPVHLPGGRRGVRRGGQVAIVTP